MENREMQSPDEQARAGKENEVRMSEEDARRDFEEARRDILEAHRTGAADPRGINIRELQILLERHPHLADLIYKGDEVLELNGEKQAKLWRLEKGFLGGKEMSEEDEKELREDYLMYLKKENRLNPSPNKERHMRH